MNVGGIVLHAFKAIFGNVDVAFIIVSFAVIYSLSFTLLGIYQKSKE